ncbi:phosphate butyryltransferase [Proteiniclasticum sp. SCR006]|uniref:Phosphate butyryltransferase n=1 Tax=Proteiniclasticum aestuarii TaxID=2817862 RepID=A0A939H8P5_9CLOT|nr:phosphate acyltransferase [Proteiniclasticum aestuarii]MBO1263437.1 phosphate butyryltransferase [Proteiniclasticum aestuarii]
MITSLKEIVSQARNQKKRIAVASAEDKDVLISLSEAERHNMASFLLFGDALKIRETMEKNNLLFRHAEIFDCKTPEEASYMAARAVSEGKADIIMKGLVDTKVLLKAVLSKELGLRGDTLLSHVMVYEMKSYPKLILLTDGGMVMKPSLKDKESIIRNAMVLGKLFELHPMKVAALSAVEKVNPNLESSVDAQELQKIFKEEKDVVVEGPLSFDIAISKESAAHKGVTGEVPGDADVLLVPSLEAGNFLGKSFTYMAGAESAGIILGAKCPVILTSRSDSSEAKLNSIALAVMMTLSKGEKQ